MQEYADYKYTCEPGETEWTPMNSNLQMQGIKVRQEQEQEQEKEQEQEQEFDCLPIDR